MGLTLGPGERYYLGYGEWAVHHDEAAVILERGYVVIDDVRWKAEQVDTVNGYPLIRVHEPQENFDTWTIRQQLEWADDILSEALDTVCRCRSHGGCCGCPDNECAMGYPCFVC